MGKYKHNLVTIAALAVVYFIAGKLGLMMAFVHPSATAVWPCAAIALAALLIFGYEVWPGVLLGAFAVNLVTAGSAAVCLGIATGNTLEALAGAWLVNRFAGGRCAMKSTRNVFRFAFLAGVCSTAISATIGVTSLALGGYAHWSSFGPIWSTWWLGDAVGEVVLVPLLLLWFAEPRLRWRRAQLVEAAAVFACLILTGLVVFHGIFGFVSRDYPLEYLCIPLLVWVAVRLGQREAAVSTLLLAGIAIWGTYRGLGPFAVGTHNESLLLLQVFIGIAAVTTIVVATLFTERRYLEEQAQALAVSDPLTGLGNYRKLIDTLESEIKRSDRTGRPFAFLLMDMDGLKKINDIHGHLVGSRALCRLADVLRMHCRGFDTAARYGGDEFALIIPEGDKAVAHQVARRICEQLAHDGQCPRISVSIGEAVWPQDGNTTEALIQAADGGLYAMKRGSREAAEDGIRPDEPIKRNSGDADNKSNPRRALAAGGVRS